MSNMHKCKQCNRSFDSQRGLTVHKNLCLNRDRSKKEYTCAECLSVFEDYPSRREFKESTNYFCCKDCKDSFERNGEYRYCSNCNAELYIPLSRLNFMGDYSIDHHFCNKRCESEWKSENWVGKNHPTYVGWSNQNSYGVNWESIREEVLNRDSYSCQKCGMNEKKHFDEYNISLHIHHKTPLRKFESAESANKLKNLETLCAKCHAKKRMVGTKRT